MRAVARYAYFNARVSLLANRLLSDAQIATLIEVSREQSNEMLKAKGLLSVSSLETHNDLAAWERGLTTPLLADLAVLVRATTDRARDFLIYWAHRYELSNLKAIIRGKMTGLPASVLRKQLIDVSPYTTLPIDELLGAEDIKELLRYLERTAYYVDIARQARRVLDAAIGPRFYAGLSQRAQAIGGADGVDLKLLVGSLIDRINLVWLLRYRFIYRLSPSEAYYLLIPAHYRLGGRQLLDLVELGSVEEVISKLPAPFFAMLEKTASISEVTEILRHWTWQMAEGVLKRSGFNLARGFAYLLLRDRELRHLRTVLKGKQLALDPHLIRIAMGLEVSHAPVENLIERTDPS
jgi:V/A-type H+-transporting ATPase subunit C